MCLAFFFCVFLPIQYEWVQYFSPWYGSFLTLKQCAKEVEVEGGRVEESYETQTMKVNTVWVFKISEKWKDGWPWLSTEDGMHAALSRVSVKNFNLTLSIELWWNVAKKPGRLVDVYWSIQRPKQAETIHWQQSVIMLLISVSLMIVQPKLSGDKY